MTVKLNKPVSRKVERLGTGGDAGEYVVTLVPPNLLEFRRKGSRRRFTVSLRGCYELAARIEAEQIRRRRVEMRALRIRAKRKGKE